MMFGNAEMKERSRAAGLAALALAVVVQWRDDGRPECDRQGAMAWANVVKIKEAENVR